MADTSNLRIVRFDEIEQGVYLQFRNRDLLALQSAFGVGWFSYLLQSIDQYDVEAIDKCLTIGGKKDGKPRSFTFDDCDVVGRAQEVATRVLDALCQSVNGKSYVDTIRDIARRMSDQSAGEDEDPPPNPGGSLSSSGGEPSGQE